MLGHASHVKIEEKSAIQHTFALWNPQGPLETLLRPFLENDGESYLNPRWHDLCLERRRFAEPLDNSSELDAVPSAYNTFPSLKVDQPGNPYSKDS